MKFKSIAFAAAMLFALLGTSAASAATLISIGFRAKAPGPVSYNAGSFEILYDNGTYTLTGVDYVLGDQAFTLANTGINVSGNSLMIGGTACAVNAICGGTDFILTLAATTDPVRFEGTTYYYAYKDSDFYQASVAAGNLGVTQSTRTVAAAAVPEPATWGLMLLGFGAVGAALRGQRRSAIRASVAAV